MNFKKKSHQNKAYKCKNPTMITVLIVEHSSVIIDINISPLVAFDISIVAVQ